MKKKQIVNMILAIIFLVLTLILPVRGLMQSNNYAKEAKERGEVVFNESRRNKSARNAQYIMLFLFGSLTLVFGVKAIKKEKNPNEVG